MSARFHRRLHPLERGLKEGALSHARGVGALRLNWGGNSAADA